MDIENLVSENNQSERMERLIRRDRDALSPVRYTAFVRMMRLALPLAAAVVIAFLFIRPGVDEQVIVPIEEVAQSPEIKDQEIAKNELLNPKFESTDNKNQPYSIVAERAVQGETNKDLIMLEKPVGVMTMKDGVEITVQSKTGAYRQDTERFFLEGDVSMVHGGGYTLESEEAHIDMQKNFAWSGQDVQGKGPEISIAAKGVHANGETGEIIFTGPAKLILEKGFEGIE